jgi:hypothetical protein
MDKDTYIVRLQRTVVNAFIIGITIGLVIGMLIGTGVWRV